MINSSNQRTIDDLDSGDKDIFKYSDRENIYFEVHGKGATKILFIHGYGSSHLTWYEIKESIESSAELYLIDLKGFGNSSRPKDFKYSPADHAEIIVSIIKQLNLKKITLAGHSYGGGVALLVYLKMLAMNLENRVDKLILIDAAVHIEKLPMLIFRSKEPFLKYIMLKFIPSSIIAKISLNRMFVNKNVIDKNRIESYARFIRKKGSRHSYIETAKRMYPEIKKLVVPELSKIKAETLIIWGENDPLIPIEHAHKLHSEFPNSQLQIIKNCGHAPQEEYPEETAAVIREFCRIG